MKVRAVLRAFAAVLVGAILVLVGALSAIAVLVCQHCDSNFGYYGCETPTAANQRNRIDRDQDYSGMLRRLEELLPLTRVAKSGCRPQGKRQDDR